MNTYKDLLERLKEEKKNISYVGYSKHNKEGEIHIEKKNSLDQWEKMVYKFTKYGIEIFFLYESNGSKYTKERRYNTIYPENKQGYKALNDWTYNLIEDKPGMNIYRDYNIIHFKVA